MVKKIAILLENMPILALSCRHVAIFVDEAKKTIEQRCTKRGVTQYAVRTCATNRFIKVELKREKSVLKKYQQRLKKTVAHSFI